MRLIIFGAGALAEICHHYFTRHGQRSVDAFVVDKEFQRSERLMDIPVLSPERAVEEFPPDTHEAFVAIGYAAGNQLRQAKCEAMRASGYELTSFVHPTAVADGLETGDNCLLSEAAIIQPFARLGAGVIVRAGSIIGHHARIGDYCYVAPGVTMSGACEVGERVFLGTGSLLRDKVHIAADSTIGMGAVVTRDANVSGVYVGHPARMKARPDQAGKGPIT